MLKFLVLSVSFKEKTYLTYRNAIQDFVRCPLIIQRDFRFKPT